METKQATRYDIETHESGTLATVNSPDHNTNYIPEYVAFAEGAYGADADVDVDDIPEPAPKKHKPEFEPVGLKSTRYAIMALGEPQPNNECIGCRYGCEKNMGVMHYEDFKKIIDFIRNNVARMCDVELSKMVAARYSKLRTRINNNLADGESEWPEWQAATIREHLWYHNNDPELQLHLQQKRIAEKMRTTAEASTVADKDTGAEKEDIQQLKLHIELVKLYYQLARTDVKKLNGYSNGAFVTQSTLNEGIMASSTKNLHDFFKRNGNRN